MDVLVLDVSSWRAALLYAVPLVYALAATLPALVGCRLEHRWTIAARASEAALICAVLSLVALLDGGPTVFRAAGGLPLGDLGALGFGVRSDLPGGIVLLLVGFIGWVIVRYSRTYLAGEPGQARYLGALLATLAAVGVVLVTNHLACCSSLAWTAHQRGAASGCSPSSAIGRSRWWRWPTRSSWLSPLRGCLHGGRHDGPVRRLSFDTLRDRRDSSLPHAGRRSPLSMGPAGRGDRCSWPCRRC